MRSLPSFTEFKPIMKADLMGAVQFGAVFIYLIGNYSAL